MSLIEEKNMNEELGRIDGWTFNNKSISKTYSFTSYMDGINFINRLAVEAEKTNHHPDMIVGWCKIVVTFTSHDKGGVTEQCIICLLYTSPSPRDGLLSRMPSSA